MIQSRKFFETIPPNHEIIVDNIAGIADLENTELGPQSEWPAALRAMVLTCLHSQLPISILWGESMHQIYNGAYENLLGLNRPTSLKEIFCERWEEVEGLLKNVIRKGSSAVLQPYSLNVVPTVTSIKSVVTFSFNPIYTDTAKVGGVMILVHENNNETVNRLEKKDTLERSENRYHKMIDEVKDYAIILLDRTGIIQNWNQGAEKIKQYHESEIVGKHFEIFYLPEDRASGLPGKLLDQAFREGRSVHEGWRLRKDRTRFWGSITLTALHDDDNNVIGFSKVTRDLTEKKIAEDQLRSYAAELTKRNEALRNSEERYHRMISEVQDYAIILLNEKGDIQNWNAGAQNIKGYSSDEIVGKNFRIFYPEADRKSHLPERLLEQAVKYGKAVHEGWRVRKDRSMFWGSIVITALHSLDGSLIGFSKVTRDLTERKNAEDKLQAYLHELEVQNKELEQFAYIASHDLQEPLRKIRTFTEIIQQNLSDGPTTLKYLQKITVSAQRMTELIQSVLNYSKLAREGEEITDVDLNSIIADVCEDFELFLQEKGAEIIVPELPVIRAIPLQISQLFGNLIGNALKFNDKKPVIKISATVLTRDQVPDPPLTLLDTTYVQIAVADNGIGFDQQYEKLIYSMFQRLHGKHQYSGTGIGLALCKRIMENHSGFITAQGIVDEGATFYLYFPYRQTKVYDAFTAIS